MLDFSYYQGKPRFLNHQIEEGVNESTLLFVPGTRLQDKLNGEFLPKLLKKTERTLKVNPSLLLGKYPWWCNNGDDKLTLLGKYKVKKDQKIYPHDYKHELFHAVIASSAKKIDGYEESFNRHFSAPDDISPLTLFLTTDSRLAVGLSGSGSVLETGITLDPLYGFPVLPGSAIKGVTRHFCEEYLLPSKVISSQTITRLFGAPRNTPCEEGSVVFYDAWPSLNTMGSQLLGMDVITPHYQKYYQENGRTYPTDDMDPKPHPFLVVRKDIPFTFGLRASSICTHDDDVQLAGSLVTQTLTTFGIGAKTGSGFGYFRKELQMQLEG